MCCVGQCHGTVRVGWRDPAVALRLGHGHGNRHDDRDQSGPWHCIRNNRDSCYLLSDLTENIRAPALGRGPWPLNTGRLAPWQFTAARGHGAERPGRRARGRENGWPDPGQASVLIAESSVFCDSSQCGLSQAAEPGQPLQRLSYKERLRALDLQAAGLDDDHHNDRHPSRQRRRGVWADRPLPAAPYHIAGTGSLSLSTERGLWLSGNLIMTYFCKFFAYYIWCIETA